MNNTAHTSLLILPLVAAICCATFGRVPVAARQSPAGQEAVKVDPVIERDQSGQVNVKLPRGARVAVDNRTTGRITVTGWDRDTVEARAISERGVEYVRAWVDIDSPDTTVFLNADYAKEGFLMARPTQTEDRGREDAPVAPAPSPTPASSGQLQKPPITPLDRFAAQFPYFFDIGTREVHLEVNVPRYAEIELIKVNRSDVEVTGVETHVAVEGARSTIKLSQVGSAEVRTKSGLVEVEKVSGLVDVITTSGTIRVREAGSDVRVLSISGEVEIRCARGRVNVGNTDGSIILSGVDGDVDVATTNSGIQFTGAIRKDNRYHLKSMSGLIEMFVRPNPAGFTAVLSSYRGRVEAAFPIKIARPARDGVTNQRLMGRYGNGQAQVTLDSFDGDVKLIRAAPTGADPCP